MEKRLKSIKTKNNIMKAAEACFSENGFDLSGIAEVCERAGVSKGAFYHHFESKDALIIELLNQWMTKLDRYLEIASKSSEDSLDFFYSIERISKPAFSEAGEQLPVFLDLWVRSIRDERLRSKTIGSYNKYLQFFSRKIQESIDKNEINDINPDSASRLIIALIIGMLMQRLLDQENFDLQKVSEECLYMIFKGVGNK